MPLLRFLGGNRFLQQVVRADFRKLFRNRDNYFQRKIRARRVHSSCFLRRLPRWGSSSYGTGARENLGRRNERGTEVVSIRYLMQKTGKGRRAAGAKGRRRSGRTESKDTTAGAGWRIVFGWLKNPTRASLSTRYQIQPQRIDSPLSEGVTRRASVSWSLLYGGILLRYSTFSPT